MILTSSVALMLSLVEEEHLPPYVVPISIGVVSFFTAINTFLKPLERKIRHIEVCKRYTVMMFQMRRAKTEDEFDKLWHELMDTIVDEPFLIGRFNIDPSKVK